MGLVPRGSYNSLKMEKEIIKRELLERNKRKKDASRNYINDRVRECVGYWQNRGKMILVEDIILGLTLKGYSLSEISRKLFDMHLTQDLLDVGVLNAVIEKHMPDVYMFTDREASELMTLGRAARNTHSLDDKQYEYNVSRLGDLIDKKLLNKRDNVTREVAMDFIYNSDSSLSDTKFGIDRPSKLTKAPKQSCPYCKGKGILYNEDNEAVECICMRG